MDAEKDEDRSRRGTRRAHWIGAGGFALGGLAWLAAGLAGSALGAATFALAAACLAVGAALAVLALSARGSESPG